MEDALHVISLDTRRKTQVSILNPFLVIVIISFLMDIDLMNVGNLDIITIIECMEVLTL